MVTDLLLAIAHHLLVFTLFGLIVVQAVLMRPQIDGVRIRLLANVDRLTGLTAMLVIAVGFARVFLGAKGAMFYLVNPVFWAKMLAFAAVAALSVPPTRRLIEWSRASRADPGFIPPADAMRSVRWSVTAELAVFPLILIFAAAMARGFGL